MVGYNFSLVLVGSLNLGKGVRMPKVRRFDVVRDFSLSSGSEMSCSFFSPLSGNPNGHADDIHRQKTPPQ